MTAIAAAALAIAFLAIGGIARAVPLALPMLVGTALIVLGWLLAPSDPATGETCRLAGIATAAAVVPLALWRAPGDRIGLAITGLAITRLAITGLALPLAAYALATTPTALPLGLAALLAAWVVGDDGPGWRVTSALGIAAIAGGTGLEYPGLAAAMLVGLSGIVASRHAAMARLAAAALALPCLLPVAAVLASRSPWLLLPLALGLLPLAGAGRARPSWARGTR